MNWSLVSCGPGGDGEPRTAVLTEDGELLRLPEIEAMGLLEIVHDWIRFEAVLREFDPAGAAAANCGASHIQAPLLYPRKLIFVGANYYAHLDEMGVDRPSPGAKPFFFLKPPTTTIVGDGDSILLPTDPDAQVDWEAELALVIGRTARAVSTAAAMSCVAGYTIVNDVSARGFHRRADAVAPPFSFDWLGSKGQDTFCPMGPGITPSWLVPHPEDLTIQLWVNGELKQDGNTDDMIFDLPTVISAASHQFTLEPGDVIATGTPAGVGRPRGESLRAGDEIRVRIASLGELRNPVEAAPG